jgi:CubicO group peptidase (beta-lactamase class C family)
MKKLLSLIGAAGVIMSTTLPVVACTNSKVSLAMSKTVDYLNDMIENHFSSGYAVEIAKNGKTLFTYDNGYKDYGNGVAMQHDTLFKTMSMTKPLTTAAFLMLWNHFKTFINVDGAKETLSLKTNVKAMWTEWDRKNLVVKDGHNTTPPVRDITLFDVLTMTSGIDYMGVGNLMTGGGWSFIRDWKNKKNGMNEFAKTLAKLPLVSEPGEKWHYGFNLDLLAAMGNYILDTNQWTPTTAAVKAQQAAGADLWECWIQEAILNPLNMHDSYYGMPLNEATVLNTLAHPTYSWRSDVKGFTPSPDGDNQIADVYNEKDPNYAGGNVLLEDKKLPQSAFLLGSYPGKIKETEKFGGLIGISKINNLIANLGWQSPLTTYQPCSMGGNALITTASDYVKFQNFMLTGLDATGISIIPYVSDASGEGDETRQGPEGLWSIQDMVKNRLTPEQLQTAYQNNDLDQGIGYGWGINNKITNEGDLNTNIGTYGWNGMLGSLSLMDPNENLAITVMTNSTTISGDVNHNIFNTIYYDLRKDGIIADYH